MMSISTPLCNTFPGGSDVKASGCNVGDLGLIPGEGNGNPLQYPCLENPMDGGAWRAIVPGVAKSQTLLNDFTSLHVIPYCKKNPFNWAYIYIQLMT